MMTGLRIDPQWVLDSLEQVREIVILTDARTDGDGPRLTYVNAAFEQLTGWTRAEVLGQTLRRLQGPGTDRVALDRIRAALRRGEAIREDLLNYRRDGGEYWVRLHIQPIRDRGGALVGFISLQADISAEHRLAIEARRREEWFRAAAEGNHNALYINECVRDAAGEVVDFTFAYVNEQGGRLVGMRPEDMIGRSICELFPVNRSGGFFERYKQVFLSQTPRVEEFPIAAEGVVASWLRQTEIPWSNGVALSPEDITPRKLAELELRQRERMLDAFLANCPGMAWIGDEHGNTLAWNGAFARMLQARGKALRPATLWEIFPPEQADLYQVNNRRVLERGATEVVLEPGPRADGSVGMYRTFKFPLGERDGVRLIGGIALDISEQEAARLATERLAAIVRSSGDAITALDLAGNIIDWNQGAERLYGYRAEEVLGRHISLLMTPEQLAEADAMLDRIHAGEELVRFEAVRRRKDGTPVFVQVSMSPITDGEGRLAGVCGIVTDVGENRRRELQGRYFAEHDPVTGAYNERGLLLAAARRFDGQPDGHFAMLRLSVDRYSEFRDVFGVQHANTLAGQVVARIGEAMAGNEHEIACIGHNQFAALVVCDAGDDDCLRERLDTLVRALAAPLDVLGIEVSIGIQCGAARFPFHARDPETLMRCADLAFGQARRNADHRPVVYQPAMSETVTFQVRLQQELSRAIEREQLRVVLQPIFDDASPPRPVGMEALVRWRHPELGEVSPAQFIPVAEESGLIPEIGEFVLREACRLKARLDAAGHGELFLSVNVSRDQFRRGDLPERVAAVLAAAGVRPDRVELEITEGVLMEHTAESERQLKALSALGIGLAVDDFGTGYSSLAYLQRFPVTKLKVDRSFVAQLPDDRGASEIVRTILTLARSLGLETLAEGVENAGQLQALNLLGCRQHQGYYFSRPLEAEAIAGFLDAALSAPLRPGGRAPAGG